MKVTERIYKAVENIWEDYNTHPFVAGIGNGTLDQDKFRFYMVQDYLYLLDYAKVFAIGTLKSKKEEHMRLFAKLVHSILSDEMNTHKDYMNKLGITPKELQEAEVSIVTESYTKYMLAIASNEGIGEVAAVVLACSWSYKCIGEYLAKIEGALTHEFYGEWVKSYSGEDYEKANQIIIDLVDELTINYSEEQIKNLEKIVINCSRYEMMFWDMAWNKEM
ncbi:MAG: thiaminase II [Anaerotignaceae bacterium]